MINLLHNAFYYIPGVPVIVLCLFCIGFILMLLFMFIIILMDQAYRPAIAQYPFNIFLDRIIPLIVLFMPTIFVVTFTTNIVTFTWLQRFSLLVCVHALLIVPLFYYWSTLRQWNVVTKGHNYLNWNQPSLYTHLAIAILYPAIWGAYFSLNRYIRLGTTVNLFDLLPEINPNIIAITLIFLLPGNNLWLKICLWSFMDLRFWLWTELQKILYVIHLYLLQYKFYFYIGEKLHKVAFVLGTFIGIRPDVYPQKHAYKKYRYILRYVYFKPSICIIIIFLLVFLELLVTKGKLHYGLYLLFIYPILYFIGYIINYLYIMEWVNDVCRADYFSRNWVNARYPMEFWIFFYDDSLRYGFNWDFSAKEVQEIDLIASKYLTKRYSFVPTLPFRVKHRSTFMRIKAAYRIQGTRWVHTERALHSKVKKIFFNYTSSIIEKVKIMASVIKNQPKLFPKVLIVVIYPLIWGIYFSLLRFIRMGKTLDLSEYISSLYAIIPVEIFFLILTAIPNLSILVSIGILFIRGIRNLLWTVTTSYLHYFHLILLQFNPYFYFCEKIFKLHFLLFEVFVHNCGALFYERKKEAPLWLKLTSQLYYKSWILTLSFFGTIILELLLFHGKLYYGIYLLFLYPFFMGLLRCLNAFGFSEFINDVCMSDYIYYRHLSASPRYLYQYASRYQNPRFYYGIENTAARLESAMQSISKITVERSYRYYHRSGLLALRVHGVRKEPNKIGVGAYTQNNKPYPFGIRLASQYYKRKGVRWFHTSRVNLAPGTKLHTLVPYLIKDNPYAILAYINHPAGNFALAQQVTQKLVMPSAEILYKNIDASFHLSTEKTLVSTLETNFVLKFHTLAKNNVIMGTYKEMKNIYGYPNDVMQMRPDWLSIWTYSHYPYKGYLGVDQKFQSFSNLGRNQAIVISIKDYENLVIHFREKLIEKIGDDPNIDNVLQQLMKTSANFEDHLKVWSESLALFPDKWKPPLRLDKSFDYSELNPEILDLIRKGEIIIEKLSDYLYIANVNTETGSLSDQALDIFADSYIHRLKGGDDA